jgi:hypothetical protein
MRALRVHQMRTGESGAGEEASIGDVTGKLRLKTLK